MAHYEHLSLRRVGEPRERRKTGFVRPPPRHRPSHGKKLEADTEALLSEFRKSLPPDAVNPELILRIRLKGGVMDDEWARSGLTLLSYGEGDHVILFSDDVELTTFRERLDAYNRGVPPDKKAPAYAGFFDCIETLEPITPADRVGPALRLERITHPGDLIAADTYLLDVELWRPEHEMVGAFINRIDAHIREGGGELLSQYTPEWGVLLRVRGSGALFQTLLQQNEVAVIDRPPVPDMESGELPDVAIPDIGEIFPPDEGAIRIGIIDSGVNPGHPLLAQLVDASFGLGGLPDADELGHGTAVAAIAAYGDVAAMLDRQEWRPRFRIVSARVTDHRGYFPDLTTAHELVEQAVRRLHGEYGCRVINISLADPRRIAGKRASAWTMMLDTLARELDIVIVTVTGNSNAQAFLDAHGDQIARVYPDYLFEDANRILEPGNALSVLTVGSLAHVNGLTDEDDVQIQLFAEAGEPSPFTRRGPGMSGAIKPDLVDFGGTAIYDGFARRLLQGKDRASCGILTLHHAYLDRLFSSFSGTSFAAPLVAYKAALLLEKFPQAPASQIRILMGLAAEHPAAAMSRCEAKSPQARNTLLGYGLPDVEKALLSDENRVVLMAQGSLETDKFAIYEVPIPAAYQTTKGVRSISVALGFEPPVRRTRREYAGIRMRYDLVRGMKLNDVYKAFEALEEEEEEPTQLGARLCALEPSISYRKGGSLQIGHFPMKRDISNYGDPYYLVVRCIGGWARDLVEAQNFSVAVMLRHEANIRLYEQVRLRERVRGE